MHTTNTLSIRAALLTALFAGLFVGCDDGATAPTPGAGNDTPAASASLPDGLILADAPADATPVTKIKQTAKEGDEVVMRVTVGGRKEPFVSGRAIMTAVEATLHNQCMDESDGCTTPWDYCCAAPGELKPSIVTIQLVDEQGNPLSVDLANVAQIKPLSTLVVKGTVGPKPTDDALVVNASGIFVESTP